MKKLIIVMMLALVCGSLAMAQTATQSKKATLMPDGSVITDIKTGEVTRITKGTVTTVNLQVSATANITSSGNSSTSKSNITPAVGSVNGTGVTNSIINNPASLPGPTGNSTINKGNVTTPVNIQAPPQ